MRKDIEKLLAELQGMKKVLDPKANRFPVKNGAWYQGEVVDDVIDSLTAILNKPGVLD